MRMNKTVIFQKESLVTNQPLTSGDHSKIVIFILLFLPSIFFGVGVIPAIFLIFGIFMMKKNEDFNHIETAVKVFRGYTFLALLICGGFSIYFGFLHITTEYTEDMYSWEKYDDEFYESLFATSVPILYLVFISQLFFKPLSQHNEWVETNGIFSTKPKSEKNQSIQSEVDIIKGEKLKQYSVADELTKWAKLKEDGHISEEEFNEARTKLLKRN
ncbi:SHOCT domain-containing protein [Neptunomonas phycophila]|uniref:SHOCT domain-containing protein n=1 Tax=Neptunomonas phycophila TaxID=1572645 RepID=UPI000A6A08B9|nr:SHOCT domain-containing protein [Neptunomonas phycophila]